MLTPEQADSIMSEALSGIKYAKGSIEFSVNEIAARFGHGVGTLVFDMAAGMTLVRSMADAAMEMDSPAHVAMVDAVQHMFLKHASTRLALLEELGESKKENRNKIAESAQALAALMNMETTAVTERVRERMKTYGNEEGV